MKRSIFTFATAPLAAALIVVPLAAGAAAPTPKPKISVAPQTIKAAKYKQDTMVKRAQRNSETTNGTTASSENPSNKNPKPYPKPSPQ